MFCEFELRHNSAEITKNICYPKGNGEGAAGHSIVTRLFKKLRKVENDLNHQARSGRPKTVDFEVVFQNAEANPANNTRRVSGKLKSHRRMSLCSKNTWHLLTESK